MSKIPDTCPKCGSQRITKLTLHEKQTKKPGGSGCVVFLLVIIIVLLAPLWLLPALGIGALAGLGGIGVFISENKETVTVIGAIVFVVCLGNAWEMSRTYICEKCGRKFK